MITCGWPTHYSSLHWMDGRADGLMDVWIDGSNRTKNL